MSQVQWQTPVVHKPSIQLAKISASEYRAKLCAPDNSVGEIGEVRCQKKKGDYQHQ